jgi:PAS domain S-box-containing protein
VTTQILQPRFLILTAVLFCLVLLAWAYGERRLERIRAEEANRVSSFIKYYAALESSQPTFVDTSVGKQLLRSFLLSTNFDCTSIESPSGEALYSWPVGCERVSNREESHFFLQGTTKAGTSIRVFVSKIEALYPVIFDVVALAFVAVAIALLFFATWQIRRRKFIQEASNQSQKTIDRLESVLQNALDCIISIDSSGYVLSFNPAAELCFGYKEDDVKGKLLSELIIPEPMREAHQKALERITETGQSQLIGQRIEVEAVRSNGEIFPVELTLAMIPSESDSIFFGFLRDITDQKAAEISLEQARDKAEAANKAKSEFLAVMSHEMRTPMNVILGMTGLVLDSELDEYQKMRLVQVNEAGETLLKLINQILDLAKIEAGKLELFIAPSNIREMALEQIDMLEPMAIEKGLSLSASIDHSLAGAYACDLTRLKPVLSNLINNALKFTEIGSVCVSLRRLHTTDTVDRLLFEVSDTGIGISSEAQKSIFEHFFQEDTTRSRRHEGTGLGLAIAREIITKMGGQIGVDSEKGAGTRFWFTLDLERSDKPDATTILEKPRHAALGTSTSLGLKILLAEDNPANCALALAYLEKLGCEVTAVANGKEALEAVDQHVFDAVLMDVQMPEMDGIEATQHIRNSSGETRHIPVIALTANAMPEDIKECLSTGMNDVLSKPLRLSEIERVLSEVGRSGSPVSQDF